MRPLTTNRLVIRRLIDDWKLLLSIFIGIIVATTLVAGAPVYIRTLDRMGMNTAIDRASQPFLDIYAVAPNVILSRSNLEESDNVISDASRNRIGEIFSAGERYLKAATYLVGTPERPLKPRTTVSRGYFQNLSNLADHVTFLSGRMATDEVEERPDGLVVEAVIGEAGGTAFNLEVGDVVVLTPSFAEPMRVSARIVGILEPTDREEGYWRQDANVFIAPQPLEELPEVGVRVDAQQLPLALFITYEALIEGVGKSYPGSLVSASWYMAVDKEKLKLWSKDEMRARFDLLEVDIADVLNGPAVFSGIDILLNRFERRSFFSSVPHLLLLVIMVVTVLYYISMMVSYLVGSRESDAALLRSRGVTMWQFAKLYAIEGLVLTAAASALAPFMAMGAISASGKLGYFEDITFGASLPVDIHVLPFVVAAGTGLLCLTIFVLPAVLAARSGLVGHMLRSSRPPATPVFQRYNLDIALVILGGLIFWELYSRGQIVSGRLFNDEDVNEALLFAPVLLLTVVALLFMRFFHLLVRYISGDSPAFMHIVSAAALATLATIIVAREIREVSDSGWLSDVALLASVGVVYYWTQRARRTWNRTVGLVVQAGLVALLIYVNTPSRDDASFVPMVVVALLVPFQLLYLLMRSLARMYPVWIAMAIWNMARNPLQYSWLVLLLVMVAGLAVLATTVGGTLDRSYEERVLYEVGADLRVSGVPPNSTKPIDDLERTYLEMPGVTAVSVARRDTGSIGSSFGGSIFSILAVDSQNFPRITWYRDDFSHETLPGLMRSLRAGFEAPPIEIPVRATSLRVWVQPEEEYPNASLRMVVRDRNGVLGTLSLGLVGEPVWHPMEAAMPKDLTPPVDLVAMQMYEPIARLTGDAGSISFDDIQAVFENGEAPFTLDDFEEINDWTTLANSSDVLRATNAAPFNGRRSGVFSFGGYTDWGIRGFYRRPAGEPVPVVASSSFVRASGASIGDGLMVSAFSQILPVKIVDTVEFFPTMDPSLAGFLLIDLDVLLTHLNILSQTTIARPNELFIDEAPGAEDAIHRYAVSMAGSRIKVHDRAALLEAVGLDPLITAGWKAMVILAAGISLFAASMGYITYLLSFASQSRAAMDSLRALGLTKRQMGWLMSAEHLVIVAFGLIIGTATGFAMSNILVSGMAVTETGAPVLPPFVLTIRWSLLAATYLAMLLVFGAALYWISRTVIRADMYELANMEDE